VTYSENMRSAEVNGIFAASRPRLLRLGYRMLGSIADAEDVVQDAFLRWMKTEGEIVRNPAGLLHTIVVRLCINRLQFLKRARCEYVGPWLPEPLVEAEYPELAGDVNLPMMVVMERLSPLERSAFLLHDIFEMRFADVAKAIGRDVATCRKLASRARKRLRDERPRFEVPEEHGLKVAEAFFLASRDGNLATLGALLAEDVIALSDGGGRVEASVQPLKGAEIVLHRHRELAEVFRKQPSRILRFEKIDGLPGFISVEVGGILQTTSLQLRGKKIAAIYVTRNPEKLSHLFRCGEDRTFIELSQRSVGMASTLVSDGQSARG